MKLPILATVAEAIVDAPKKRDRHIFLGQTIMGSFNCKVGITFPRGKYEPVPGRDWLRRSQRKKPIRSLGEWACRFE